jgi:hypothetical protein
MLALYAVNSLALASPRMANLILRQTSSSTGGDQAYFASVCSPPPSGSGPLPPCISIANIEAQCAPKNNTTESLRAHAACMCQPPSSFFSDWAGCQSCLFVHGGRSQADEAKYSGVIKVVSAALCAGTPTATFAAILSSAAAAATPSTGATILSDQFPSQTAISLYFTVSGSQGPGPTSGMSLLISDQRWRRQANYRLIGVAAGDAVETTGTTRGGSSTRSGISSQSTAASTTASRASGSSSSATSSNGGAAASSVFAGAGFGILAAGGALLAAL